MGELKLNIIIMGAQGSGKDTQGERLASVLKIPLVTSGDVFRAIAKENSPRGKEVKKLLDSGNLGSDEMINGFIKERLLQEDCKKGFILNGYPRNLNQVRFLDSTIKIEKVVVLDIAEKVAIERISSRRVCKKCNASYNLKTMPPHMEGMCDRCGEELVQREDDHPSAIKKRLQIYHEKTTQIINYYKKKHLVVKVDGAKPIEEVQKGLLRLLRARKKK
ncbi:MAG: nucleoside monophosphate kinase [Nanoarchaeota archaeon]